MNPSLITDAVFGDVDVGLNPACAGGSEYFCEVQAHSEKSCLTLMRLKRFFERAEGMHFSEDPRTVGQSSELLQSMRLHGFYKT